MLSEQVRADFFREVALRNHISATADADGVTFTRPLRHFFDWPLIERVMGTVTTDQAGLLTLRWMLARLWVDQPVDMVRERVMVMGMPAGHPLHPGQDWVVERVHGASLDLGLGAEGVDPDDPDAVLPIPAAAWQGVHVDPSPWWPVLRHRHERLGEMSALRHVAAKATGSRHIRPAGGHDVVTLLGTASLREALAAYGDAGMASVAVPERHDGMLMTRSVDPAFAGVLAAAAPVTTSGFAHPVLVTQDEVVLVPPLGDLIGPALNDTLREVPRTEHDYFSD